MTSGEIHPVDGIGPDERGPGSETLDSLMQAYDEAERLDLRRARAVLVSYGALIAPIAIAPMLFLPMVTGAFGSNYHPSIFIGTVNFLIMASMLLASALVVPLFVIGTFVRLIAAWKLRRHLRRTPARFVAPLVEGERFGDWRITQGAPDGLAARRIVSVILIFILVAVSASLFMSAVISVLTAPSAWMAGALMAGALAPLAGLILGLVRQPVAWRLTGDKPGRIVLEITTLSGTLRTHRLSIRQITSWHIHNDRLLVNTDSGQFALATIGSGEMAQWRAARVLTHLQYQGLPIGCIYTASHDS